jgi:hypothetical protein
MGKLGIILMLAVLAPMLPAAATAGLSPLEAISMIESGNNDAAIGPAGEVSRYQIQPRVWRQLSESNAYEDAAVASSVAQQHLDWLYRFYKERTGRVADDFDLYVMWNAGADYYRRAGFAREKVHPKIRGRAERYVNLRQMRNVNTAAVPAVSSAPEAHTAN